MTYISKHLNLEKNYCENGVEHDTYIHYTYIIHTKHLNLEKNYCENGEEQREHAGSFNSTDLFHHLHAHYTVDFGMYIC